jgi:hypothetical protein
LRQEDAAAQARAAGLSSWIRGTVAQAEVGARRLNFEEVLLLALAYGTTPAEFLVGEDEDLVELAPRAQVPVRTLRALLSGQAATTGRPADGATGPPKSGAGRRPGLAEARRLGLDREAAIRAMEQVGEAERHAARRLGTTPDSINLRAVSRWGRTLAEERDARVAERAADASPRQLQALRGHVTRELLTELASDVPTAKDRRITGSREARP